MERLKARMLLRILELEVVIHLIMLEEDQQHIHQVLRLQQMRVRIMLLQQ